MSTWYAGFLRPAWAWVMAYYAWQIVYIAPRVGIVLGTMAVVVFGFGLAWMLWVLGATEFKRPQPSDKADQ